MNGRDCRWCSRIIGFILCPRMTCTWLSEAFKLTRRRSAAMFMTVFSTISVYSSRVNSVRLKYLSLFYSRAAGFVRLVLVVIFIYCCQSGSDSCFSFGVGCDRISHHWWRFMPSWLCQSCVQEIWKAKPTEPHAGVCSPFSETLLLNIP